MQDAPRILVVDDEPKICEFLSTLLKKEGYAVDTVFNAQAAITKLGNDGYNLVISDLKMPGMDGFELTRHIRRMDAEIPLVVMTGFATLGTAIQALRQGVDDYVSKPFKISEMRRVVYRVLEKARLAAENRRLVADLEHANAELKRHREALQEEVRAATEDVRRANTDLRRRVSELAMLNEIATAAASELDLQRLLANCVQLVMEKLHVERVSVLLVQGDSLVVKASSGGDWERTLGLKTSIGEGVAGHAAQTGEPVLIRNISLDDRFPHHLERGYTTTSLICQPIKFKDEVLGVISVTDKRSGEPFTEGDQHLLSTIASQMSPAIENARLYKRLEDSTFAAVRALVAALEAKDAHTSGHSRRVTDYALAIGKAMGIGADDLNTLERASQLHDLGKLGVSDLVLNKPGALTEEEYSSIKCHPVLGQEIVQSVDFLREAGDILRQHHERPDGAGYPDGKHRNEINLLSRIMSVADVFDAMTSSRPYRAAKTVEATCAEISSLKNRQFDPDIVDVFCDEVVPDLFREEQSPAGER